MRRTDRLALAVAITLVYVLAPPAAAEETKKPAATMPGAAQQTAAEAVLKLPLPDFRGWPDDQYLFILNSGDKDYTGALELVATCKSTAPRPQVNACGQKFPNGKFSHNIAHFEAGHGPTVAPIKGSGNAQIVSGYGWRAVFMGLPAGTFEITLTIDPQGKVAEKSETNNASTKTVTIPGPRPSIELKAAPVKVN